MPKRIGNPRTSGIWPLETQYGRYRIKKQLGRGNMGVVYLAHDPQIDRLVALKVLRPDKVVSEDFVQRFLKEARAIGRLTHPNIVVVYDVGRDHGTIYIAMEYLEGRPFDTVLSAGQPDLDTWSRVGAQLADTLAYAHENGIIHRDIKPSNIIMSPEGHIKLTDFGIARIEDPEATLQTQVGDILGTPAYMSPEQVAGQAVDGRSDLFSLGVILYEWLLGQRPFRGKNMAAIFNAITLREPPHPSEIQTSVPKPIADLLLRCLAKPTADRFQDGRQMAAAIRACTETLQTAHSSQRKDASSRRYWILLLLIGMSLTAYVAGPSAMRNLRTWMKPTPPPVQTPPATSTETPPTRPLSQPPSTVREAVTEQRPTEVSALRMATLRVTSTPAGAQLFIDGDPEGRTPSELELPVGTYGLRLNLEGHHEWRSAVQLSELEAMPLHIHMVRRE